MDPTLTSGESKSVLQLALELGVRGQTLLQTMQTMGLEAESTDSPVDPGLETRLIEQLVDDGNAPQSLLKGKGRRDYNPEEPLVNDDMLKEAMGASESGYNEESIPRQIQLESTFEQPGFFGRLFGKKNNLAKSLSGQELSDREVDSLFSRRDPRQSRQEPPPSPEPDSPMESEAMEEVAQAGTDDLQEAVEGLDDLEVDDEALGEIDDLDDINLEELEEQVSEGEDVDLEGLENFDDIGDLDDLEDLELDDLDAAGDEGEEGGEENETDELEGDDELELDTDDLEGLEAGEGGEEEGEEEEEHEPGFFERIFDRIQLSPAEMWTVMLGSIATMAAVLGIIVYWWLNLSPQAQKSLWEQALEHYTLAKDYENFPDDYSWAQVRAEYQDAADLFEQFIEQFPQHENTNQAFEYMSDSYYQIAKGWERAGKPNEAEEPYRVMIQLYENYLDYLDDQAMKMARGGNLEQRYQAFPDDDKRRQALLRIAEGHRKLQNFEQAIARLKEFVQNYRQSPQAVDAQIQIAKAYQDMAEVNKEQENTLLSQAVRAYQEALQPPFVKPNQHRQRMDLYKGMGDVHFRQYQIAQNANKPDQASTALQESVASYEQALDEFRQADNVPFGDKVDLFIKLADLYLIRGKQAGEEWRNYSETGSFFAEGLQYREELLNAAERSRERAGELIGKAQTLYDELLENRDDLSEDDIYQLLFNTAESDFILQNYEDATQAAQQLLDRSDQINDDTKLAQVHYLLGHIAWQQAKESGDYSKVKEHYREALRLDPFYPADEKGEVSHLADIRLTNAYFMLDERYEDAIARYQQAVESYPDTGYTFLTLYWYGKALESYGDQLMKQAEKKEAEADEMNLPSLKQEAQQLRNRARNLFDQATLEYTNAMNVRDDSKYVDHQHQRFLIDVAFWRADSAFKARNFTEAETLYKQALDTFRHREAAKLHVPRAIEHLGDINAKLLEYGEAIKHYNEYLNQAYEDKNARVSLKLADAYLSQFSYNKARGQYNKIINFYPPPTEREIQQKQRLGETIDKNPGFQAMKKIAQSYYQQATLFSGEARVNTLQKALDAFGQLAESFPKNPQAEPQNRIPDDPESQLMTGNIHYELGNYRQAAQNYDAFLQEWPNYPRKGMIYYRMGEAYSELKDWNKAIEALSLITPNMMDNDIQHADAMILLGQAYENKANEFLQQGDGDLYTVNLERAQDAYNRVNTTNSNKRLEARLKSQNIETRLSGQRNVNQPSENAQSLAGG